MTKNQINYLLALATFVVLWLFFNTFYMGAKTQSRMFPMPGMAGMAGKPMSPMMNQANFPYMPSRNPAVPRVDYMASLPPEAQKILAERRAKMAAASPTAAPAAATATKTEAKKK